MNILVINCGSSSIKYQLIEMQSEEVLAKGVVEKIGLPGSFLKHSRGADKWTFEEKIPDHTEGIKYILGTLISKEYGSIASYEQIDAVGHRVVHGGEKFSGSVLLSKDVLEEIRACVELAPLHNPANLIGIEAMMKLLPSVPQVGAFDTAFHQTMPEEAYLYALPYELYKKYGVRRYGFHGTSHRYVSARAFELLKNKNCARMITCHLGNGGSIAAIRDGKVIDTSMGLTPTEGLVMGTRCGDIDPGIIPYLMEKEHLDAKELSAILNKKSGVFGISQVSSDMRELEDAAAQGNKQAQLALDIFHYRVRKYIGSYAAVLGGVDVIVFTGGIGENADTTREIICKDFEYLGLEFDAAKNKGVRGKEQVISSDNSRVTAIIIPTNEELVIAQDTKKLVAAGK